MKFCLKLFFRFSQKHASALPLLLLPLMPNAHALQMKYGYEKAIFLARSGVMKMQLAAISTFSMLNASMTPAKLLILTSSFILNEAANLSHISISKPDNFPSRINENGA